MRIMDSPRFQISLVGLFGIVACVAVNLWLFRLGVLWGVLGLNVTKHVVIAQLCHAVGVNRKPPQPSPPPKMWPEPSSN